MARTFPPEVSQLAASNELGTPVKRYTCSIWCMTCLSVVFILTGLPCLIGLSGFVATFLMKLFAPSSSTDFSFLMGFFVMGVLLSPLSALFFFLARLECATSAYEYTGGFVLIRKRWLQQPIEYALLWDQIASTSAYASRYGGVYKITDVQDRELKIPYLRLWKKCKQAAQNRPATT